eukprot:1159967-Pelagomonas_calceolata.AAC.5
METQTVPPLGGHVGRDDCSFQWLQRLHQTQNLENYKGNPSLPIGTKDLLAQEALQEGFMMRLQQFFFNLVLAMGNMIKADALGLGHGINCQLQLAICRSSGRMAELLGIAAWWAFKALVHKGIEYGIDWHTLNKLKAEYEKLPDKRKKPGPAFRKFIRRCEQGENVREAAKELAKECADASILEGCPEMKDFADAVLALV